MAPSSEVVRTIAKGRLENCSGRPDARCELAGDHCPCVTSQNFLNVELEGSVRPLSLILCPNSPKHV
jgi:hypothetical protein